MEPMLAVVAVGILAAFVIPAAVKLWREYQEDKRTCGNAGCIDAGQRFQWQWEQEAQQQREQGRRRVVHVERRPPQRTIIVEEEPDEVIYVHAAPRPEPRIVYVPSSAQSQPRYLPAPQVAYAPDPQIVEYAEEYQQLARYIPQGAQMAGQLPPPTASEIHRAYEARKAFERERGER